MTTAPSSDTDDPRPAPPDGWAGTILTFLLTVVAAALVFGSWALARREPTPIEAWRPIDGGVASRYRVEYPDGSVGYQSTNLEWMRNEDVPVEFSDPGLFGILMKSLGIDIQNFDAEAAIRVLNSHEMLKVVDTIDEPTAADHVNRSVVLIEPDRFNVVASVGMGFDPPIPLLIDPSAVGSSVEATGTINGTQPYAWRISVESHGTVDGPTGSHSGCAQVKSEFSVGAVYIPSDMWFCPGIGLVREEVGTGQPGQFKRFELVSYSVARDAFNVMDPGLPAPSETPVLFQQEPGDPHAITEIGRFIEKHSHNQITTRIVPMGDIIAWGTLSGGLVAFDPARNEIRWRFQTGSVISGAPVLSGGIVYVGSADRHLYALDAATGAFLWAFVADDAISASPVVVGGHVIVGSEDGFIYGLDPRTGPQSWMWAYETGGPVATTPAVRDNTVYFGSDDGAVYALDAMNGSLRWVFVTDNRVTAPPLVWDDVVIVSSRDGNLYGLETEVPGPEGEARWTYAALAELEVEPTLVGDEVIIPVLTGIRAIDAATGEERWRMELGLNIPGRPQAFGENVAIQGEHEIIFLSADTGGEVARVPTCASAPSGELGVAGDVLLVPHLDGTLLALGTAL